MSERESERERERARDKKNKKKRKENRAPPEVALRGLLPRASAGIAPPVHAAVVVASRDNLLQLRAPRCRAWEPPRLRGCAATRDERRKRDDALISPQDGEQVNLLTIRSKYDCRAPIIDPNYYTSFPGSDLSGVLLRNYNHVCISRVWRDFKLLFLNVNVDFTKSCLWRNYYSFFY